MEQGFDERVRSAHARFAALEQKHALERGVVAPPADLGLLGSAHAGSALARSLAHMDESELSRAHQRNGAAFVAKAQSAIGPRTVPLLASASTGSTHSYAVRPGRAPAEHSALVRAAERRAMAPAVMARTLSLRAEIAASQIERAPPAIAGFPSAHRQPHAPRSGGCGGVSASAFSAPTSLGPTRSATAASTPRAAGGDGGGSAKPALPLRKARPASALVISRSKRLDAAQHDDAIGGGGGGGGGEGAAEGGGAGAAEGDELAPATRAEQVDHARQPQPRRLAARPASAALMRRSAAEESPPRRRAPSPPGGAGGASPRTASSPEHGGGAPAQPQSARSTQHTLPEGGAAVGAPRAGSACRPPPPSASASAAAAAAASRSARSSPPPASARGGRGVRSEPPSRPLSAHRDRSAPSDSAHAAATVLRLRHPASARAASVSASERALAWDELPAAARELLRAEALAAVDAQVRAADAEHAAILAEAAGLRGAGAEGAAAAGAEADVAAPAAPPELMPPTFFPIDAFDPADAESESDAWRAATAVLPPEPPPPTAAHTERARGAARAEGAADADAAEAAARQAAEAVWAHSRFFFPDGSWQWSQCRAIAWDSKRRLFTVEWGESRPNGPAATVLTTTATPLPSAPPSARAGATATTTGFAARAGAQQHPPQQVLAGALPSLRKPASRLNLLFDGESPLAFAARVLEAIERRRATEAQLRYASLLNSLPSDQAQPLGERARARIGARAALRLASAAEPRAELWQRVIDDLWAQVRADWERAHVAIDFEARHYAAPWRLPAEPGAPFAPPPPFGRLPPATVAALEPAALAAAAAGAVRVTAEPTSDEHPPRPAPYMAVLPVVPDGGSRSAPFATVAAALAARLPAAAGLAAVRSMWRELWPFTDALAAASLAPAPLHLPRAPRGAAGAGAGDELAGGLLLLRGRAAGGALPPREYEAAQARQTRLALGRLASETLPRLADAAYNVVGSQPHACFSSESADAHDQLAAIADGLLERALRALARHSVDAWAAPFLVIDQQLRALAEAAAADTEAKAMTGGGRAVGFAHAALAGLTGGAGAESEDEDEDGDDEGGDSGPCDVVGATPPLLRLELRLGAAAAVAPSIVSGDGASTSGALDGAVGVASSGVGNGSGSLDHSRGSADDDADADDGRARFEPSLDEAAAAVMAAVTHACNGLEDDVQCMARAWRPAGVARWSPSDNVQLIAPKPPQSALPLATDARLRAEVLGDAPASVAATLERAARLPRKLARAFERAAARLPADPAAFAAQLASDTARAPPEQWRAAWTAALLELRGAREHALRLCAGEHVRLGLYEVGLTSARATIVSRAEAAIGALCAAAEAHVRDEVAAINAEADAAVQKLSATAADAEAWAEQRAFSDAAPALAVELEARAAAATERMGALDAVHHSVDPLLASSHFAALGAAQRVARAADEGEDELLLVSDKLQLALRTQRDEVEAEVDASVARVGHFRTHSDAQLDDAERIAASAAELEERLARVAAAAAVVRRREAIFGWEQTHWDALDRAVSDFAPLAALWRSAAEILTAHARALDGALLEVDLPSLEASVSRWSADVSRIGRAVRSRASAAAVDSMAAALSVVDASRDVVLRVRSYLPTLRTLRTPGLKARHWAQISEVAGHIIDPTQEPSLSLENVLVLKLAPEAWKGVQEVADVAAREFGIERALDRILAFWRSTELDLAPHPESGSRVLRSMEDTLAAMDEHTARCLAMAASPHAAPVAEPLAGLLASLRLSADTLDAWFHVQRGWLHLQPLFAAADIERAMPAEARKFGAIDRVWRATMDAAASRPNLLRFCSASTRVLEVLRESVRHLDSILRSLSEFLEGKRLQFPRFFFLADEELLALLSRAHDPLAVQPHLHKCFEGIVRLVFEHTDDPVLETREMRAPTQRRTSRAGAAAAAAIAAIAAAAEAAGAPAADAPEPVADDVGVIVAMRSAEGETVRFEHSARVDPNLGFRKGRAELWLSEVELAMRGAVRAAIRRAVLARGEAARASWAVEHPAQAVLAANCLFWTSDVEQALEGLSPAPAAPSAGSSAPIRSGSARSLRLRAADDAARGLGGRTGALLRSLLSRLNAELGEIVESVRGELPALARTALGALIVLDVHQRDVVALLLERNVASPSDFDWQAQLRFYDDSLAAAADGEDAVAGATRGVQAEGADRVLGDAGGAKAYADGSVAGRLHIRMVSAARPYAFEYLGASARLVVTPLTDRCYRTLLGAVELRLGGAPEGPAGTGKTETVKDLAKAVATQCVVFNCSEGLDAPAMGKFFKGLASCGAWSCFDEFNRIQLEVLSVVAQQVLAIQLALGARVGAFSFEGATLRLHAGCAVFITMNPGYAGRAELPDNLSALFRPCAMMVPDYAMIAEISLHAGGFHDARVCAAKLVGCLRLCSEQLSARDHYDWGMRTVKAVIMAAAALKAQRRAAALGAQPTIDEERVHTDDDGAEDEDELALTLGALRACTLPKLSAADAPLFLWISRDLFPATKLPSSAGSELGEALAAACEARQLQPTPSFLAKCEQLHDTFGTRHGLMLVGGAMAGKTAALRVLRDALLLLEQAEASPPARPPPASPAAASALASRIPTHTLNPKALPLSQLYGSFDAASREWTDGVVAQLTRSLAGAAARAADAADGSARAAGAALAVPPPWRGWLVFDGPVDPLWIENLNTALDDNKKLCLASGEVIRLPDGLSMIFEVADLAAASPATVSRTGMVFFEPEGLGWRALVRSWLERLPRELLLNSADLESAIEALLPPLLGVALRAKALVASTELALVASFLTLLDALLRPLTPQDDDAEALAAAALPDGPQEAMAAAAAAQPGAQPPPAEADTRARLSRADTSTRLAHQSSRALLRQGSALSAAAHDSAAVGQALRAGSLGGGSLGGRNAPPPPQKLLAPNVVSGLAVFAALWALGGPLDQAARARACAEIARVVARNAPVGRSGAAAGGAAAAAQVVEGGLPGVVSLPPASSATLFDFSFDPVRNEWAPWVPPGHPPPPAPGLPFSLIVIPTAESARIAYLLRALWRCGAHALLVGESGVGKSTIVRGALQAARAEEAQPAAAGKRGARGLVEVAMQFSAKTPSTLAQAVVDARMVKRRRGVYGPPRLGQRALVVVDDLSAPAADAYGSQPPLELLRQLLGQGGWYAPSAPGELRSLADTHLVATMRPEGTSAARALPPRLRRHLVALGLAPSSPATLERVYGAIVGAHLAGSAEEVRSLGPSIVRATISLYASARETLLPTPAKPHYTFNARDVAAVAEGIASVPARALDSREALLRLWAHEASRVFADRLLSTDDCAWFDEAMAAAQREQLGVAEAAVVPARSLLFGAFDLADVEARAGGEAGQVGEAEEGAPAAAGTPGGSQPMSLATSRRGSAMAEESGAGSRRPSLRHGASAASLSALSRRGSASSVAAGGSLSRRGSATLGGGAHPAQPEGPMYREVARRASLRRLMEAHVEEHNERALGARAARPLSLVLFDECVGHVCRIHRVLRQPGGHMVLLGMPGSGRRSAARLAAHMLEMDLLQPTPTASGSYGAQDWRDDLRRWTVRAGRDGAHCALLLSDADLDRAGALDDIHELLSSGGVFGLFGAEEGDALLGELRAVAANEARDGAADAEAAAAEQADAAEVWAWCARRVRERLHLLLCASPADWRFRERVRTYPALVDCCALDFFADWPNEALADVARARLAPLAVESEQLSIRIPEVALGAAECHRAYERASAQFSAASGRLVAVAPASFLNLLELLAKLVREDAAAVVERQRRYAAGLRTLALTTLQVETMSAELAELRPQLVAKTAEADAEARQLEAKQQAADAERAQIGAEEAACILVEEDARALKAECEANLARAMPALEAATSALRALRKEDVTEVKSMKSPPEGVKLTMEAVCILRGVAPAKRAVRTSSGQTVHLDDYWEASRKMLGERDLIGSLLTFKKDSVPPAALAKLAPYVANPAFQPEPIGRASKAAQGLCKWVLAVNEYCRVAELIAPKRAALAEAERSAAAAAAALAAKKLQLAQTDAHIRGLREELAATTRERAALQAQVDECGARLGRAERIVLGLGGERARWEQASADLAERVGSLAGDMLLAAAAIAGAGALDAGARARARQQCESAIARVGLRASSPFELRACVGEPMQEVAWRAQGLPADSHSAENALIMAKAVRWPYLLDPHGLATAWVRKLEGARSLMVARMASERGGAASGGRERDGDGAELMRMLESAMLLGAALLVEHAPDALDESLDALLAREVAVSAGAPCVRLGGRLLEISPEFRIYFANSSASPQVAPETAARVCVLNFQATAAGLEEQLLHAVVEAEKPALAEARVRLVAEGAENRRRLREDEERILKLIGSASGSVLDDDGLVGALDAAHASSAEVALKARADEAVAADVEAARALYQPVARRASELFGAVSALRSVHRVYQWDLAWFLRLFKRCIAQAQERAREAGAADAAASDARVADMRELCVRAVHADVHRALRSEDKLAFDVGLASRLRLADGSLDGREWAAFARTDAEAQALAAAAAASDDALPPRFRRPAWLPAPAWAAIVRLSEELPQTFGELQGEIGEGGGARRPAEGRASDLAEPASLLHAAGDAAGGGEGGGEGEERAPRLSAAASEAERRSEADGAAVDAQDAHDALSLGWRRVFDSPAPQREPLPAQWAAELSTVQRLLLLKALRPDACQPLLTQFVAESLGAEYAKPAPPSLEDALAASEPFTPILLVLTPGADPTAQLLALAAQGERAKLDILSLGQGMGARATALVGAALQHGSWVLLQNCHLAASYMPQLEALIERLHDAAPAGFRLWLTSAPTEVLPDSVLRASIKLTTEPARGLRANLRALWESADDRFFDDSANPRALRRLYYALSLFHAAVLERRRFGPIGWNLPYAFSTADFHISARQLRQLLDGAASADVPPAHMPRFGLGAREPAQAKSPSLAGAAVPWDAVAHYIGDLNYGGRVTDERDRRLLSATLSDFMHAGALGERHVFCEGASAAHTPPPTQSDVEAVRRYVASLPADTEAAEAVGLSANAQIASARAELAATLAGLAAARARDGAADGSGLLGSAAAEAAAAGVSVADSSMLALAQSIERALPQPFALDAQGAAVSSGSGAHAVDLRPSYEESMNVVLAHELARYNGLLAVVRDSLRAVAKALLGVAAMSSEAEATIDSLRLRKVPASWSAASYPSRKALGSWTTDLARRVAFFGAWVRTGAPRVFWIAGFFSTQAFITGIRQNYARKNAIAIDRLSLHTEVLAARASAEVAAPPEDGAYVDGLYLEGCRWSREAKQLEEARPKELHDKLPVLWLCPSLEPPRTDGVYETPIYRTSARQGKLSTTGHSSNFVMMAHLPTDQPEKHWVKRGVALLCALDD